MVSKTQTTAQGVRTRHRATSYHESILSGLFVTIIAVLLFAARDLSFRPGLLPVLVGVPALGLALFHLYRSTSTTFRNRREGSSSGGESEGVRGEKDPSIGRWRIPLFAAWVGVFIAVSAVVGFLWAVPVALLAILLLDGEAPMFAAVVTAGMTLAMWAVFDLLLGRI
jgi:Tripartite tricarboxylate transporter TctB family